MNLEDYNEYYIQGSDHYLIPKYVFKELFNEMSNWRDESKQLKEIIEEVREYIEDWLFNAGGNGASMNYEDINELLQILDKAKERINNVVRKD